MQEVACPDPTGTGDEVVSLSGTRPGGRSSARNGSGRDGGGPSGSVAVQDGPALVALDGGLAEAAVSSSLPAAPGRVLVLNASYEPINVCTVRRASILLLKSKAELIEQGRGRLRSERMEMDRPCVIRLLRYVRIPRDVHQRRITRRAVLARDGYTCQYCGTEGSGLTVDHVIPRSRGGGSGWENIVAACAPCNRKKGNRLPREARMPLMREPAPPASNVFIRVAARKVPPAWETYLQYAA